MGIERLTTLARPASMGALVSVASAALVVACGSSLSSTDVDRLHNAQRQILRARSGEMPANSLHQAYCQVHCVLESAREEADVDASLPCTCAATEGGAHPPAPADAGSAGQ